MAQLELLPLQHGVGARPRLEFALLALPHGSVRQVLAWICRAHGQGARTPDVSTGRARDLDPRCVRRGGASRCSPGPGNAENLPTTPRRRLVHDRYRPCSCSETLRSGERVLSPDGLCICDPAISPCASSGAGNARRNGILAEFLAYRPRQRSTNCGCERAYLGPLMAELSALRAASAQNSGQRRSVPGANAT